MLNDRKITDWTQPVSSLDDRPQMTAAALKAAFDSNTNQIKPAVNGMIDDLTGTGGAGNIGVDVIAGVTGTTVQAMLAALKALIDLCDTSAESDDKLNLKADKTTTDKLVKTITLNADTGVFTIQTDDGTTRTIDTLLEKIPVNCYLDGQEFVLVLDDGTEQRADLSDFITETEFTDSSTIDFSVTGSNVTATIKNGSITLSMLENTVITTLQGYMTAAQTAAVNAATSETNAGTYRDQAQESATAAASSASEAGAKSTLSESWAIGGTGTRQGEDTNNSKYFAQQSANSAATAQGWSDSAMEQADKSESAAKRAEQAAADAEAIAGGDYIPNSQKGVAGGVATLDATGKLEETQKPDYTASEVGAVPTTRTVNGKSLSADVVLTGEDIKTSASDNTHIGDVVSVLGGATTPQGALAALGAGVRPNLLDNAIFIGGGTGGAFPVNQRQQMTYLGSSDRYTIDRWRISGQSTLTVNDDSVTFSVPSSETARRFFAQYTQQDLRSKIVTLSILMNDGSLYYGTGQFPASAGQYIDIFSIPNVGDGRLSVDNPQKSQALFMVNQGASISPVACKLEEGDTQTLAYQDDTGAWQLLPQPESDYATQLARCQRYQLELISKNDPQYACIGNGTGRTSGISGIECHIFISTPITLRTRPVVTFNGNFYLQSGDSSLQVTRMALDRIATNGVNVLVYAENIEIGKFYSLYATISENHSLLLDANL